MASSYTTTTNKLKIAENYFRKILNVDSSNYYSLVYLGLIAIQLKKNDASKNFFKKAILINPKLIIAYVNLGIVYTELNEFQKAINCYQKAIEINPQNVETHINLGSITNTAEQQSVIELAFRGFFTPFLSKITF